MMDPPRVVLRGATTFLAHTPGLVRYGSKPRRELRRSPGLLETLGANLRSFEAAAAYPPNRAFLGSIPVEALASLPRPWFTATEPVDVRGPYGCLAREEAFYGLLKAQDAFNLIWLDEAFIPEATEALAKLPLVTAEDMDRLGNGVPNPDIRSRAESEGALPLYLRHGRLVGCVSRGHEEDPSLSADVLLENLAAKTTAVMALRTLFADEIIDRTTIPYVLNTGEEAVGDRYQRGGGNLAKAVAECCGCVDASGADVKAFCCGPVHAIVMAGALVAAGIFEIVAVVGGCSLAKLGMKFQGHLARKQPILEDVLAGVVVLVGRDDGHSPVLRLDAVGRHRVKAGGAQEAILQALAVQPLERLGLGLRDVDKYATELHNPEVTEPAGSGNVPLVNYRLLAGLAVARREIARENVEAFVATRGMPGFSPTQGHIASAVPFLPHAIDRLRRGRMARAMFLAKGSLFLGRMTQLSDGFSFILERNAH